MKLDAKGDTDESLPQLVTRLQQEVERLTKEYKVLSDENAEKDAMLRRERHYRTRLQSRFRAANARLDKTTGEITRFQQLFRKDVKRSPRKSNYDPAQDPFVTTLPFSPASPDKFKRDRGLGISV